MFHHLRLADFTSEQVAEYAHAWFSLDDRYVGEDLDRTVEAFLAESMAAPELRVNPLMLGLMCVLYRGQSYIPRNRPELYRQCATFLFETWDRHRGISADRPFERLLRPAMRELAYWIYTSPSLEQGVPYEAAVKRTTEFLLSLDYGDQLSAENAARSFIDFCRGRAWVFSDVGANAADHDVFAFTHRTFLEFFAAERILDRHETTTALVEALQPHVYSGDWDVVPELAIQIHEERHLRSADKCLQLLLGGAETTAAQRSALGFAVRLLHGVVPAPETVANVTTGVLSIFHDAYRAYLVRTEKSADRDELAFQRSRDLVVGLLQCDPEARPHVAAVIDRAVESWLTSSDRQTTFLGCDLALSGAELTRQGLALAISEQREWWIDRFEALGQSMRSRVLEVAVNDVGVAVLSCARGWIDGMRLLSMHGIGAIFARPVTPLSAPALQSLAQRILECEEVVEAEELNLALCEANVPWINRGRLAAYLSGWRDLRRVEPHGTARVASILILCAAVEPALDGPQHPSAWPGVLLLDGIREELPDLPTEARPPTLVDRVLDGRGHRHEIAGLQDELRASGYPENCVNLLGQWLAREISFVGSGPQRPPQASPAS